jgi:small subunit ribosomal protein S2
VQLYTRAAADSVLEGKAAAPSAAAVREEDFGAEGDAKGDKRGPRGPRGAGKKPEAAADAPAAE